MKRLSMFRKDDGSMASVVEGFMDKLRGEKHGTDHYTSLPETPRTREQPVDDVGGGGDMQGYRSGWGTLRKVVQSEFGSDAAAEKRKLARKSRALANVDKGVLCSRLIIRLKVKSQNRTINDIIEICALARGLCPFFQDQPLPISKALCRALQLEHFEPNAVVVEQGTLGDKFYAVVSGNIDIYVEDVKVTTLGVGHTFGEMALISGLPRSASCVCKTVVDLVTVDKDTFLKLFQHKFTVLHKANVRFLKNNVRAFANADIEMCTTFAHYLMDASYPAGHVFPLDNTCVNIHFVKDGDCALCSHKETLKLISESQRGFSPMKEGKKAAKYMSSPKRRNMHDRVRDLKASAIRDPSQLVELSRLTVGSFFGDWSVFEEKHSGQALEPGKHGKDKVKKNNTVLSLQNTWFVRANTELRVLQIPRSMFFDHTDHSIVKLMRDQSEFLFQYYAGRQSFKVDPLHKQEDKTEARRRKEQPTVLPVPTASPVPANEGQKEGAEAGAGGERAEEGAVGDSAEETGEGEGEEAPEDSAGLEDGLPPRKLKMTEKLQRRWNMLLEVTGVDFRDLKHAPRVHGRVIMPGALNATPVFKREEVEERAETAARDLRSAANSILRASRVSMALHSLMASPTEGAPDTEAPVLELERPPPFRLTVEATQPVAPAVVHLNDTEDAAESAPEHEEKRTIQRAPSRRREREPAGEESASHSVSHSFRSVKSAAPDESRQATPPPEQSGQVSGAGSRRTRPNTREEAAAAEPPLLWEGTAEGPSTDRGHYNRPLRSPRRASQVMEAAPRVRGPGGREPAGAAGSDAEMQAMRRRGSQLSPSSPGRRERERGPVRRPMVMRGAEARLREANMVEQEELIAALEEQEARRGGGRHGSLSQHMRRSLVARGPASLAPPPVLPERGAGAGAGAGAAQRSDRSEWGDAGARSASPLASRSFRGTPQSRGGAEEDRGYSPSQRMSMESVQSDDFMTSGDGERDEGGARSLREHLVESRKHRASFSRSPEAMYIGTRAPPLDLAHLPQTDINASHSQSAREPSSRSREGLSTPSSRWVYDNPPVNPNYPTPPTSSASQHRAFLKAYNDKTTGTSSQEYEDEQESLGQSKDIGTMRMLAVAPVRKARNHLARSKRGGTVNTGMKKDKLVEFRKLRDDAAEDLLTSVHSNKRGESFGEEQPQGSFPALLGSEYA